MFHISIPCFPLIKVYMCVRDGAWVRVCVIVLMCEIVSAVKVSTCVSVHNIGVGL